MFKKVKEAQLPKRGRKQDARFATTEDWAKMRPFLDEAAKDSKKLLKPGEALTVQLTAEEMEAARIKDRKTIFRFVKEYVAKLGLPYDVRSFHKDGLDYVVVRPR